MEKLRPVVNFIHSLPPIAEHALLGVAGLALTSGALWYFTEGFGSRRAITTYELIEKEINDKGGDRAFAEKVIKIAAWFHWAFLPFFCAVLGYEASCEDGMSNWAYIPYGVFLLVHLVVMVAVGRAHYPIPCCGLTSRCVLVSVFLALIEHIDVATDAWFPGVSAACPHVDELWIKSTLSGSIGGWILTPLVSLSGFGGFALLIFLTCSWLPQLLCIWSVFTPIVIAVEWLVILLGIWIHWGLSLLVLIVGALVLYKSGVGWQLVQNFRYTVCDEKIPGYGTWAGMALFEVGIVGKGGPAQAPENRPLITGITPLFHALVQLWLQVSFFACGFDSFHAQGRYKLLASLGCSAIVIVLKVAPAMREVTSIFLKTGCSICGPPCCLVFVLTFLVLFWAGFSVYCAFMCESHLGSLLLMSCTGQSDSD